MLFLEQFLNALLRSPTLASSEIVEGFLRNDDSNAIVNLRRAAERTKKPELLSEIPNPEGVLQCNVDYDAPNFKKLSDFVSQSEVLKTRLRTQSQQLKQALDAISASLADMKDTFKQLYTLQQDFSDFAPGREIYYNMAKACTNWRLNELDKSALIESSLSSLFLYQSSEMHPLKEIFKEREASFLNYVKTNAKIEAKKERLWSLGDTAKWELAESSAPISELKADKELAFSNMLHNETLYVNYLKDRYAFYNFQAKSESERVLRLGFDKELVVLRYFSKKEAEICTKQHFAWTQLMQKLTDMEAGVEEL